MRIEPDTRSSSDRTRCWYASTDKNGYDGSGATPLDAMADLCEAMERALGEASDG